MSKNLIVEAGTLYKKAQGEPGEGPSFEQQFGILANAQITDKYPSLSNYQIAVQLLDKADDNSFAACAVVYKLGQNIIYVPATYYKGKIITGEIMEVPGEQRFLPLSDAWLNWVKNRNDKGDAENVAPQDATLYGRPAGSIRSREPIDPLLKNASLEEPSLFNTVLKLGKKAALKFMDYLENPEFTNQAFKFYSPQDIKKFASAALEKWPDAPETELITVMDKRASALTDDQKKVLWQDGFIIKRAEKVDWGPADSAIKVTEKKDLSSAFITPGESCKCEALLSDGDTEKITLLLAKELPTNKSGLKYLHTSDPFYVMGQDEMKQYGGFKPFVLKGTEGGVAVPVKGTVTAIKDSVQKLDVSKIGTSFQSAGDLGYDIILVLPTGSMLYVQGGFKKDDKGGLYSYDLLIRESQDKRLRGYINYDKVLEVPKGTRVIKCDSIFSPSNAFVGAADLGRTIERYLDKNSIKIKMTSDGQEISFSGPASKPSDRFMEKDAAMHLVKNYGVCPQDAKAMLKMAGLGSSNKLFTTTFYLHKNAAYGDVDDESFDWKPADIGMTQITEEPPEITEEDLQNKAQQDAQDMETIQKATDAGVKEVFDTSVLKLLMQDADPTAAIMEAIPDFMTTLDKLCQMLFLYRCHMQDMEERYGAVKMKSLEKSLQNTIKDLSELTIFIKLRGLGNGQSPDAGDLQTGTMMQ